MLGTYKPFEQQLFNENDPLTRTIVKEYFKNYGYDLIDNPYRYGIDLMTADGKVTVEVERSSSWKNEFKFPVFHLLGRKEKTLLDATMFCSINQTLTLIAVVTKDILQRYVRPEYLKEVGNVLVGSGEYFYQVPVSEVHFDVLPKHFSEEMIIKQKTMMLNIWNNVKRKHEESMFSKN